MTLQLTLACYHYDRTEALRDGRVRPEGIDLNYLDLRVEEIFWRMLQHREFDAAELSFGGYVVRRARGEADIMAIPVFPSRFFRHSCVFVNERSGIRRPEDLRGKRVGVPEYQMTAAVWQRGAFADDYDLDPRDIEWIQGGLEEPGRVPFEPVQPKGVSLGFAPPDRSLAAMLAEGTIDALFTARTPSTFHEGEGPIRRLFDDPWEVEREYFRRTAIFPMMHTIGIKAELLEQHPWIAQTLFKAFSVAKDLCVRELSQTSALPVSLPFLTEHAVETKRLMGDDFWPYGLEANRKTLETFVRYMHEQGLIESPMPIESLFAPQTFQTFRI